MHINSLTDDELSEIRSQAELVAGGHSLEEHVNDAIADLILQIFIWIAIIGFVALAYFIGLLVKSVACPFQDECDVLRPWWDWDPEPTNEFPRDRQYYEPSLPTPNVSDLPDSGSTQVCDPRQEACEWSVR